MDWASKKEIPVPIPRFSEDVRSVTDLKSKASTLVDQVRRSRRPVVLTQRGRAVAVLLDLNEYERLAERAAFIEAVEAGAEATVAGRLHEHREAEAILETFGEPDG